MDRNSVWSRAGAYWLNRKRCSLFEEWRELLNKNEKAVRLQSKSLKLQRG